MARYIDIEPILAKLEEFAQSTCDSSYEDGIRIAMQVINEAPVTDVQEVKHARWYKHNVGNKITVPITHYYVCSNCDRVSETNTKYCPYCGAKMDGDKNV